MHGANVGRSRAWSQPLFVALALGLVLGALPMAGCGDEGAQGEDTASSADRKKADGRGGVRGFEKEWWNRKVPISVLFAGGQRGRFRVCGCTEPQTGGLKRAASLLQRLRRRAAAVPGGTSAALALGWSMRGDHEEQEQAKADFLRGVYEALGFSGVLLGASDLTVPAMCQPRGTMGPAVPHPPLNVGVAATNPAAASTAILDVSVGTLQLRAFRVLDPKEAAALEAGGFLRGDRKMSATQAFAGLIPQPDKVWIVAASPRDETTLSLLRRGLQRLGPAIVVDLSGEGLGQRRVDRHALRAGQEPLVVSLDDLGTAVGVLDFEPADGSEGWRVSYRQVDLVPSLEKLGGPLMNTVGALEDVYREMVAEEGYLESFPRSPDVGASYVGSSACARCHPAIYNEWKKSSHAVALETLKDVDSHRDPDCVRCHVVGWRRTGRADWTVTASAFRTAETTAYLGGVGCESCHGAGSRHVQKPWVKGVFAAEGPNAAKPGLRDTCVKCHDGENSHGFAAGFDKRHLPQVDHRSVPQDRRTVMPLTDGVGPAAGRKDAGK